MFRSLHKSSHLLRLMLVVTVLLTALTLVAPARTTFAADATCPLASKTKVTWVSPRGTLEVMDDYCLWVAKKLGYFDALGVDVDLQPGPVGGANVVSLLPAGQADISFPSPGVLAASIDAGIPVIIGFEMSGGQVFDFAVPADSTISSVKDLAGKTIALGSLRSEEHTSELQSHSDLVCRLLLEKKRQDA